MLANLAAQPSNYVMSNGRGERDERVQTWESPKGQPTFAVLHRYGLAADVPTGLLHLTSLIYAHLREAGTHTKDERRKHLEFIVAIADSLIAFANDTKERVKSFDKHTCPTYRFDRNEHLDHDDELAADRSACINDLLDAFRTTRAWTTCDRTVDRGRRTTGKPKPT